jgi:hypothetical protein
VNVVKTSKYQDDDYTLSLYLRLDNIFVIRS